jgi:predicted DNA-binding transcriptional regulator AlpA
MDQNEAVWLTATQLSRRFSISLMALWRWVNDPNLGFPAPLKIRERNYWRLAEIEDWERAAAAKNTARRVSA